MSDGLSECRRLESHITAVNAALLELEDALGEVHDAVFGLPSWAVIDIEETLAPFGLVVSQMKSTAGKDGSG